MIRVFFVIRPSANTPHPCSFDRRRLIMSRISSNHEPWADSDRNYASSAIRPFSIWRLGDAWKESSGREVTTAATSRFANRTTKPRSWRPLPANLEAYSTVHEPRRADCRRIRADVVELAEQILHAEEKIHLAVERPRGREVCHAVTGQSDLFFRSAREDLGYILVVIE